MRIRTGQILYMLPQGNFGINRKEIIEVEVEKVTKIYGYLKYSIEFSNDVNVKFYLEDLTEFTNYTSNYQLYISKEDIYDRPNLIKKLIAELGNFSYKELQQIESSLVEIKNNRL